MYDLRNWTGTRSLCRTLNISRKTLFQSIRDFGFPARRVEGRGAYRVIPEEYFAWLRRHGLLDDCGTAPAAA